MSKRKFSKEQELQICNDYFSKEVPNIETLANWWGCCTFTIRDIIIRNGHTLRTYSEVNKKFTEEQELKICIEYFSEKKPSTYFLAKKYNCTDPTIGNIIRRNGYKARTISEAHKDKKRLPLSEEHKRKIREAQIGEKNHMFGIHRFGEQNPNFGNVCSEKTKQILREKTILQHQTQHGPYKDTKPELKMKEILIELTIPFEHQFRIDHCLFDFHIPNTNILIEVDGDYFHANPKKYSILNAMQLKMKERDKKHNEVALSNGFILIRFWESDILKNTEKVKNELMEVIDND